MAEYRNNYDDLLRRIHGSGQSWSYYDLNLARENPDAGMSIFTAKDSFSKAQTDEDRLAANRAAEQIRQKYGGYSGGKDGSGFTLSDKYAPPVEEFTPTYGGAIDDLLEEIMGREPFTYSPGADPSYQAYSEKYRGLGRQAREDTMGSAAAMTGGQLSSYALTAGQQAQNAYNAQLSDKIPELEQLAYDMYLGDLNQKRTDLSTLQGLDETEYGRFRDQRGDKLDNYQLNYQVGRDDLSDQRYEDETKYNREQDALDRQYQQDADSFNRAMDRWQVLGYLDEEGARALGIPAGTQTSDYRFKLASAARSASSGGGGGSTGGKSGSGGGDYDALFKAAMDSGYPKSYIANHYKEHGFTSSSGLYDDFTAWDEGGGSVGEWDGIDKSSVTALGYGPISRAHLEELVDSGEVEMYVDSATGLIKFRKSGKGGAASGPLASMLLP